MQQTTNAQDLELIQYSYGNVALPGRYTLRKTTDSAISQSARIDILEDNVAGRQGALAPCPRVARQPR
jgi:hypothetical protein